MRVHFVTCAVVGALALAGCQSSGPLRYPDEASNPPYPSYPGDVPPPPPPPAAAYSDEPMAYSNQAMVYSEPLPPPPAAIDQPPTNEKEPVIAPYSADGAVAAMDQEEDELRGALSPSVVTMRREGGNLVVEIQSDLLFDGNSATLTPQGRDMAIALSHVVQRYPSTYVNVDGFTDAVGERESNITLSQDRADAVADVLAADGVETRRLSAVGHGWDFPRVQTGEGVSESKNRRVEITLEPYAG